MTHYWTDARLAGQVVRWHTAPMARRETVGEHSWQVARLVLAFWPDAPRDLLVRALLHDVGEVASGDVPFPVKSSNPALGREIERVEHSGHLAMCIPWGLPSMPQTETAWLSVLKLADLVDMWETAAQEAMMGSRFGRDIIDRLAPAIQQRRLDLASTMPDVAMRVETYINRRQLEWKL